MKPNTMTPSKQEFENECLNKPTPPKQQSIEDVAYTEHQVRTAYKAGVLRGLEYKSRGKKKTVYETPSEEQLIQTLKKKL